MPLSAVYLDYQASTPIDPSVMDAMSRAYAAAGNASAEAHSFGWAARDRVETARRQVAALINAEPEEVVFTSGASEANNIAILGAARAAPLSRRRILVSALEHKSVSEPAFALKREGFTAEVIPVTAGGVIDVEWLKAHLGQDVAVLSVMAVNNEIGTIQPIEAVTTLGRSVGAFVHVDATQAVAAAPIDFRLWGPSSIALSAHKIYGPGGVGAIVVADDAPWRPAPLTYGGGQEEGLRPGTVPVALCTGLGVACDILSRDGADERQRVGGCCQSNGNLSLVGRRYPYPGIA
jgi:cysteine desulfurase